MRLKAMSTQRGKSLEDLLSETRMLREEADSLVTDYIALLQKLSRVPEKFERRFWVPYIEAVLEKARTDYRNYESQALKANLLGKMTETMVNLVAQATGQRPMAHVTPLQTCISISPSGEIEPALFGDPSKRQGHILLSMDGFERIAQKLKEEIMSGKVVPESEHEIPKLMYDLALRPQGLPEPQT
jgi:hypothetical protein